MKKQPSLKSFHFKKQKDLLHLQSSTQLTDSSDFLNSSPIFETPKKTKLKDRLEPEIQKLISRTSSVSLFKETPKFLQFEFFGSSLTLDVSGKIETPKVFQKWLQGCQFNQEKKAQIKLVVYEELFKRNIEFNDVMESALQEYAEIKMRQIQEKQIKFHKNFE